MATKKRKKPYEYGDELLEGLLKNIAQLFRRRRLMDFDEINAHATSLAVTQLYGNIDALIRKRLYSLWDELYEIAYLEEDEGMDAAVPVQVFGQKRTETRQTVDRVGHASSAYFVRIGGDADLGGVSRRERGRRLVDELLSNVNPVTKYSYDTELDRKRARLFECLVVDRQTGKRRDIDLDYAKAEKEIIKMTRQYFIDVEDVAVIRGYADAGVKEVMWMTQLDGRVCGDCSALDAKIFPINELPPKPHMGCRCYWKAVKR